MNPRRTRQRAATALLAVPLLWVGGCGDSGPVGDDGASETRSSQRTAVDLDSIGGDLLSGDRWGGPVPGDTVKGSWRFPESYEATGTNVPNNEATSQDGTSRYRIVIGAYPGRTKARDAARDAARDLRDGAESAGQSVTFRTLSVGDRKLLSVTQEEGGKSRRNLFYAPDLGNSYFLVVLESDAPLDATPRKRLEEYYQTAASLRIEKADG